MRRKPIKLMTAEERRVYNRDNQRQRRARIKADPELARIERERRADHTARWLARVLGDAEKAATYKERQRVRNREKYWRKKNSPRVEKTGLQRPKNPP